MSSTVTVLRSWYVPAAGSAPCDWLAQAPADRAKYRPSRVVIAFTGNDYTCARPSYDSGGMAGWLQNYRLSLERLHDVFNGLPITVLASPAMNPTELNGEVLLNGSPLLNQLYEDECRRLGMKYSTAADDTLTPGHIFVWSRPAYPGDGPLVPVRRSDGIHVLPAGALYYAAALIG